MEWEVIIGFETHAQLSTQSKIFSGAPTAFGGEPNAHACAVDIALPGVLPVMVAVGGITLLTVPAWNVPMVMTAG